MRRFQLTFRGSKHSEPYSEAALLLFIKDKLGKPMNDYRGQYVTKTPVVLDDFQVNELVPVKIQQTLEIV